MEKILLQLLAPFVLGQLLQPWIGAWVRGHKKILMPVDRGSILMVVYLAFSHAMAAGVWREFSLTDIAVVILIDIVVLALVLALTTWGSRMLGFSREDELFRAECADWQNCQMAGVFKDIKGSTKLTAPYSLPCDLCTVSACIVVAESSSQGDRSRGASPAVSATSAVPPARTTTPVSPLAICSSGALRVISTGRPKYHSPSRP